MKQSSIILYIILLYLTFSPLTKMAFFNAYGEEKERNVSVEVVNPITRTLEQYIEIVGTCYSTEKATFGPKIDGSINKIYVDEGDRIRKGQLMAELDTYDHNLNFNLMKLELEDAKIQVVEGQIELEKAKTDLDTKKMDFERLRDVYAKKSISKQQLDYAKNNFKIAQSNNNKAKIGIKRLKNKTKILETHLEIAKKRVLDCKIKAPFDGVISARHSNLGEWVKKGESIFTVEADNPIEIKGDISEIYLSELKLEMPVRIEVDGLNGSSRETSLIEAKLDEISAVAHPRQRTVQITVKIDNSDHLLKPGLFARMKVIFQRSSNALVIPEVCLIKGHNAKRVFVINENRAEIINVETGIRQDEMIEIRSGLTIESRVVVRGKSSLIGGEEVTVQE